MTQTYTMQMPDDEVVTFRVNGNFVAVTDRQGTRTLSRADARQCWKDLVGMGGERFECHDEDGHDGERCTCGKKPERVEPPVGSWASVARLMVQDGLMSGDEADAWKDQMKEGY